MVTEEPVIRVARREDIPALVTLERKILGQERPEFWEMKLEYAEERSPMAPLVAEVEGKVVGFVMGDASGWEFGIPNTIGWIDILGVDPDYQGRGIGRALMLEMIDHLKKVGVETIYALANWRDWDMLRFLDRLGFRRGDMIHLELKV